MEDSVDNICNNIITIYSISMKFNKTLELSFKCPK